MTLWGPFLSKEDSKFIEMDNIVIRRAIPPQIKNDWLAATIGITAKITAWVMIVFIIAHFLMHIFLKSSLTLLWCVMVSLQVLIHTPLMNLYFPGSCFLIYSEMIKVVNFDFLPSGPILSHLTKLEDRAPIEDRFDRFGNYGNVYLILSMGTLFIFFLWHCFIFVAYFPIGLLNKILTINKKCSHRLQSW